jgi:hypothetical protein
MCATDQFKLKVVPQLGWESRARLRGDHCGVAARHSSHYDASAIAMHPSTVKGRWRMHGRFPVSMIGSAPDAGLIPRQDAAAGALGMAIRRSVGLRGAASA